MRSDDRSGRRRWAVVAAAAAMAASTWLVAAQAAAAEPALRPAQVRVEVKQDDAAGLLKVLLDGSEVLTFHYPAEGDLPYFVPKSPSGKALTVVQTNPYPHHRSVWFADTVQLAGRRKASFYNALYSRKDKKDPNSPFMDRVRVARIAPARIEGGQVAIDATLLWEMDRRTPVLDESRRMRLVALGGGEYLLDLTFTVTAAYGDVAFLSDAAHYAWPYVRMDPAFSVDKGGTMTSSEGGVNQKATHNAAAWWIDYSNTVGGAAEGLALLVAPAAGGPPKWLTRDYGTFGPRRDDARNGRPFTLRKGDGLTQRVALLIHRGDVKGGKVAQRYAQWAAGIAAAERKAAEKR